MTGELITLPRLFGYINVFNSSYSAAAVQINNLKSQMKSAHTKWALRPYIQEGIALLVNGILTLFCCLKSIFLYWHIFKNLPKVVILILIKYNVLLVKIFVSWLTSGNALRLCMFSWRDFSRYYRRAWSKEESKLSTPNHFIVLKMALNLHKLIVCSMQSQVRFSNTLTVHFHVMILTQLCRLWHLLTHSWCIWTWKDKWGPDECACLLLTQQPSIGAAEHC